MKDDRGSPKVSSSQLGPRQFLTYLYTHTHTHAYTCTCARTYMHTHAHTRAHIHTPSRHHTELGIVSRQQAKWPTLSTGTEGGTWVGGRPHGGQAARPASGSGITFHYLRTEKLIAQGVIMPLSVPIVIKPIRRMITYVNECRYNTLHSTLPSINIIVYAL